MHKSRAPLVCNLTDNGSHQRRRRVPRIWTAQTLPYAAVGKYISSKFNSCSKPCTWKTSVKAELGINRPDADTEVELEFARGCSQALEVGIPAVVSLLGVSLSSSVLHFRPADKETSIEKIRRKQKSAAQDDHQRRQT